MRFALNILLIFFCSFCILHCDNTVPKNPQSSIDITDIEIIDDDENYDETIEVKNYDDFDTEQYSKINTDEINFVPWLNWSELPSGEYKSNDNTGYAYINDTNIANLNIRVDIKVDWQSSGDLTGIFLLKNPSSENVKDGYYYLIYPYQNAYVFLKRVDGKEIWLENGDAFAANPSNYFVSLEIRSERKLDPDLNWYNEFYLYCNQKLISIIKDNEINEWKVGFGKYNRYESSNGKGIAWFKNVSVKK